MIRRMALSAGILIVLLAVCAVPAVAQQKLGDFISDGGYDWVIGKWAAASDEGKIELEYKWGLNKCVVLIEMKTGQYKNRQIVMLNPDRGEVIGVGADNQGGTWKGDWTEEYGDIVYRVQNTTASRQVNKVQVLFTKVDADTMTVGIYGVDSSGYRNSAPSSKLTFKRQPTTAAADTVPSQQTSQMADHETLGDLVAQGGYEWMAGKWLATEYDQKYELEHTWALDKHVVLVDLKMGDFAYHGMIMLNPAWQEIFQVGADNMGGIWNGTWDQAYEGATHRVEYTSSDGMMRRMEHVYVQENEDAFKVKEYPVTAGSRASQPSRTLAFQRQKTAAGSK